MRIPTLVKAYSIWLTVTLFVIFQFFLQLSNGVMVDSLMADFSIDALSAGILSSSYYYMYAALQIPTGLLFDRFGPRYILTIGSFLCGLGCLLFAASHYFYMAVIARLMMGAGAGVAFVGMLFMTIEWFPIKRYAFMVGTAEMLAMFGAIAGNLELAKVIKHYSWRISMQVGGYFAIGLAFFCFFIIQTNSKTKQSAKRKHLPLSTCLKAVLCDKFAFINGLYIGFSFSVVTVFAALWATPFLLTKLNISLYSATLLGCFCYLGAAISCPLYGFLSESLIERKKLMVFSMLSSAFILLIIIYTPTTAYFFYVLMMFLLGLSCASYMLSFAIAQELAPQKMANTYAGYTNTLAVLTAPLLQPLIGFLLDIHQDKQRLFFTNDYQQALFVMPLILIIAAILVKYLPAQHKHSL